MEFEQKEIELIKLCIIDRIEKNRNFIDQWTEYEWDKLGNLQNMYANKQAFQELKAELIENWKKELEELEELENKIDEEY